MTGRPALVAALVAMGAGWGLTTPLMKIAVSEGYRQFGLIFWQMAISGALLTGLSLARRRPVPLGARHLRLYALIAAMGTILPNAASYAAAVDLPAGVLAILLSTVPLFAFPVAIALGNDRFERGRALGLVLGLGCVALIVGPEASLPDPGMAALIPLALIAPFFYGVEGNVLARWGSGGLDPVQVLAGAAVVGMPVAGGLALVSGQWIDPRGPWGAPDAALVAGATINAAVYAGYFWLVGRAGPVFAAQVSYLITGFGVAWSMMLLGESYRGPVWAAMGLLLVAVFLVQPRPRAGLAPAGALRNYEPGQQGDHRT